jgi:inosine/xanthosine triphosphatase
MTTSIKLSVASTNPVKLKAVERSAALIWRDRDYAILPVSVDSQVSAQPLSNAETLKGAENRANAARLAKPHAHYWFGIEGGVEPSPHGLLTFAWIVVIDRDRRIGRARSASFLLPEVICAKVLRGMELGQADDEVFGRTDSKRKDGAIGLLTAGALDRTELYAQAVTAALIPFLNPRLYPPEDS